MSAVSPLFPPPPKYYKNYAEWPSSSGALQPPPPPGPTTPYSCFGVAKSASAASSLAEGDKIYDSTAEPISELKKLNYSLIANYIQLLDILVHYPAEYATKVQDLRALFKNMIEVINNYRPHEAREMLIEYMNVQAKRKSDCLDLVNKKLQECQERLFLVLHQESLH
ncbi:mediator of RNA polymerase II transcription subunit 7 [Pelomyxa schiedti]|nr:mediator of RNA polymerase II transcription subunit 7 [Pelomyxa schiedti]